MVIVVTVVIVVVVVIHHFHIDHNVPCFPPPPKLEIGNWKQWLCKILGGKQGVYVKMVNCGHFGHYGRYSPCYLRDHRGCRGHCGRLG